MRKMYEMILNKRNLNIKKFECFGFLFIQFIFIAINYKLLLKLLNNVLYVFWFSQLSYTLVEALL